MQHERRSEGLLPTIAVFVGAALAINALIFLAGWDAQAPVRQQALVPPGPVVGAIWVVLFALMATARWRYVADSGERRGRALLPTVLAILCLGYPIYTGGLADERVGLAAALVLFAATMAIIAALWSRSRRSAAALIPTAAWLGYVSVIGVTT